ncbi:hypothetical protein BC830DRAFT_1225091 [Chytriomyces sp. MP71]|nr:hypothetical protein BC830DRAFT_1225091 [Chytriomyces sp. MP71]
MVVKLGANGFFRHFATTPEYALVTNAYLRGSRDWIVAVPSQASLAASLNDAAFATRAFVSAHILVRCEESVVSFVTLGSKRVSMDKEWLLVDGQEKRVRIVDDLLYTDEATGAQFLVYCIEEPLMAHDPTRISLSQDRNAHESILSVARIFASVKDAKSKHASILDDFSIVIGDYNDRVLGFENLDVVKEEMKRTLDACFDILDKIDRKLLTRILDEEDISLEALYQLLETYVMEKTYEFTYFLISKTLRAQDTHLSNCIGQITHLDLAQLQLSSRFGVSLQRAVTQFQNLATLRTPMEKVKCLLSAVRMLNPDMARRGTSPTRGSGDLTVSSDVLIPLLVLIVVRSKIQNLPSSLHYMLNFSFEHDVQGGEYGYALATLEAVISFITENASTLALISSKNAELWEAVKNSDFMVLDAFFAGQEGSEPPQRSEAPHFVDIRNPIGDSLLHIACRGGFEKVVAYLLGKKLPPNSQNYSLECPLHIAASLPNSEPLVSLLLARNADTSSQDVQGNTPFLIAAASGQNILLPLLYNPLSANCNKEGFTAYHLAKDPDTLFTLFTLLPTDTHTINTRTRDGLTPLLHHAHRNNFAHVEALQANLAADPRLRDAAGRSLLHVAAFRGQADVLARVHAWLALSAGDSAAAFVNASSARGNTALHAAAEPGHMEAVRELLRSGARAGVRNLEGRVAGDVAGDARVRDMLDNHVFLERAGKTGGGGAFAIVARFVKAGEGGVRYCVKSLTTPELSSIITATRSLKDFEFFRRQLLLEFPDTFLPVVSDVIANDAPLSSYTQQIIKQVVSRLNGFLRYVISHPLFAPHDLLRTFLSGSELNTQAIESSTNTKLISIEETIESTYPNTVDAIETATLFFQTSTTKFTQLKNALNETSQSARKLGVSQKSFVGSLLGARFHIAKPSSHDVFGDAVNGGRRFLLVDVIAKMEAVYLKQQVASSLKLSEILYDAVASLHSASATVSRHAPLAAEYTKFQRETGTLATTVSRLERQAMTAATEDIITKLSEVYFRYDAALKRTQGRASRLNYMELSLKAELAHFQNQAGRCTSGLPNLTTKRMPPVLIVIDLQTAMFDGLEMPAIYKADQLVANTRAAIAWARTHAVPVVFVQHCEPDGPFSPSSAGWPIWHELRRLESEPVFTKTVGDSFSNPALVEFVEQMGKEVILLGAQSDMCVNATTLSGLERKYDVTVIGDAHSTWFWDDVNKVFLANEAAGQISSEHNNKFTDLGAKVVATSDIITSLV